MLYYTYIVTFEIILQRRKNKSEKEFSLRIKLPEQTSLNLFHGTNNVMVFGGPSGFQASRHLLNKSLVHKCSSQDLPLGS